MTKDTSAQSRPDSPNWMVCAGCACLCDDILRFDGSQGWVSEEVLTKSNLCNRGLKWFHSQSSNFTAHIRRTETILENAIVEANRLIAKARSPLICSLEGLCTASQSAAWRLADRVRATIDVSLSNTERGGMNALQRVGKVTATMGEVAHRSDLILLWFVDPQQTHPRLWERVVRPQQDLQRFVVVVDETETESSKKANLFIRLDRNKASVVLSIFRAMLVGARFNQHAVEKQTGLEVSRWQSLLDRIRNCSYGAMFSKAGLDSDFDSESELLAKLIRALNDSTRFVNLSLRNDHNAQNAENVLAWSSGFASGVNLNRGFPRSCHCEYSAEAVLADQSCDLILMASTANFEDAWNKLCPAAQSHLQRTPTIVLNELAGNPCGKLIQPQIEIAVARPGFTSSGDFCRLDDVLIPLSQVIADRRLVSAGEVLNRLAVSNQ